MLAGQGKYSDLPNQLGYVQQAFEKIKLCGRNSGWALLAKGDLKGVFSKCMHGPMESFSDFVACLIEQ